MNVAVTVSKETAIKVMGSSWCVDHDARVVYENLGLGRPPFHFDDTYASPADAAEACPSSYAFRPLPSVIRLPKNSPIALGVDRDMENARPKMFLLRFGGLMERGLRIERCAISAVDYAPAPFHLKGAFDFVAGNAYLGSDPVLRVRIGHDGEGYPYIEEAPRKQESWGWTACGDVLAFLSFVEAEAHADRVAERLRAAADWRRHGY